MLYCDSFINCDELHRFTALWRNRFQKYPFPQVPSRLTKDENIGKETLKYLKSGKEPSQKMEYEYVMEFCQNHNFSLDKVNEVGHAYKYGMGA